MWHTVQCNCDIRTSLNLTSLYLTRGTVLDVLYMVRKETNFRHKVNTPQIGNKILFAWEKNIPSNEKVNMVEIGNHKPIRKS